MADSHNSGNLMSLATSSSTTIQLPNLSLKLNKNNYSLWGKNTSDILKAFSLDFSVVGFNPPPKIITVTPNSITTATNSSTTQSQSEITSMPMRNGDTGLDSSYGIFKDAFNMCSGLVTPEELFGLLLQEKEHLVEELRSTTINTQFGSAPSHAMLTQSSTLLQPIYPSTQTNLLFLASPRSLIF
ncbi:hypothetical protein KY285_035515 [Solanum tuberosum]|nr:hypothetical protein KY284_035624 [Solanum tuberosum]KAH0638929.1 hypothetical protein KY285_035515 [Solanum tuberosum]